MNYDYPSRISRLKESIAHQGMDALLVSSQDSIYYLSGASYLPLERPFFILIKPEGVPDIVVPQLELEHMRKVEGFGTVSSYFEYPSVQGENWYDKLGELLGADTVVGIEPSLSVSKAALLKVRETRITTLIDDMRMVKEPAEIQAIRLAAKWTDEGMQKLHGGLYAGQSTIETTMPARKIQTGVLSSTDYEYLNCSFLTAGWPAPQSAQPHSIPDFHTPMGKGPIVLMSFNRVNGYAAECERTVFLEEPIERERQLFGYMMKAREIAYSMVKPGASCSDIDAATQEYFKSVGCADNIIHRTGHGIGMGNHEQPWLSVGSEDILRENMVISIEPAIYFADIGGFRHSDTVLVTKDSYEILTGYPDDLDSLIVSKKRTLKSLKGKLIRKAIKF